MAPADRRAGGDRGARRETYLVDLTEAPLDEARAVRHAEEIFLLDGEGRIRGVYNGSIAMEIDHLIEDARALLEEVSGSGGGPPAGSTRRSTGR